jgi:hypothetical protein
VNELKANEPDYGNWISMELFALGAVDVLNCKRRIKPVLSITGDLAGSLRHIVEEPFNGITRRPFRANPRAFLHPAQLGQNRAVKIPRAFSFELCLNFESLIRLSDCAFIGDDLLESRFDG